MTNEIELVRKAILRAQLSNSSEIVTIYGDTFEIADLENFTSFSVKIRFKLPIKHDPIGLDEILTVKDESECPPKILYEKKDPLFDKIKEKLGYKMHESEIWMILNMVHDKYPKEL